MRDGQTNTSTQTHTQIIGWSGSHWGGRACCPRGSGAATPNNQPHKHVRRSVLEGDYPQFFVLFIFCTALRGNRLKSQFRLLEIPVGVRVFIYVFIALTGWKRRIMKGAEPGVRLKAGPSPPHCRLFIAVLHLPFPELGSEMCYELWVAIGRYEAHKPGTEDGWFSVFLFFSFHVKPSGRRRSPAFIVCIGRSWSRRQQHAALLLPCN